MVFASPVTSCCSAAIWPACAAILASSAARRASAFVPPPEGGGTGAPAGGTNVPGGGGVPDGAVGVQVAAAHAGGFDGEDDLAGSRYGIGEFLQLELPLSEKDDAAHDG